MRPEAHLSVAAAEVREAPLAKHAGEKLGSATFAMASATGRPRLWSYANAATLRGFTRGLDSGRNLEGATLVEHAFLQARGALVEALNVLVERNVPDVALIAVHFDHHGVHVMSVGDSRAYLHRGTRTPQRMTPREGDTHGLLEGDPTYVTVAAEPGDLVLAGSASAFSASAVGRVASALQNDSRVPPAVLAALLTEPAAKAGVGAVALALRIR
ncbi:MAG: hypothetical protein H6721_19280 [Sandaracinus sp.]|nr:hypothetical protein [Myxococcales bacterium]MCB9604187.1 hypothetical protein [Sandaracinus sp.]MCB9634272.1 hypothetical protein [Sandaracinus sp.]